MTIFHYNIKNSKSIPLDETIYAAVIALGCNIGVRKMGEISEGIGADKLEYTVKDHCKILSYKRAVNPKLKSLFFL